MALESGSHLGPYEVIAPLGAGGMGEVYRAHDPRLGRDVAIKVLRDGVAADPDRLRRFEREARATGALNHPNILGVHDIGMHDGAPYVVSELLEGETLRKRLRSGVLPTRQAIDYAVQMARGLAAAHEKGIVHRDIKPENVCLTQDGRVKILDFGLAKLLPSGPLVPGPDGTAESAPSTESGAVVGTVGYMSPEQVRGQAVDHRSDIFALGAVLYELLSGRRAFRGDTQAETLTAILREDPPELTLAGHGTHPALERITRRCLEKDPAERFQSARDVAFALGDLGTLAFAAGALAPDDATKGAAWRRWMPTLVALALLAGGAWLWRSGTPAKPLSVRPLTSLAGAETHPALSPEGDRVAFAWNGGDQLDSDIYVTLIGPGQLLQLTDGPSDDRAPVWSPDGQQIAFVRTGETDEESGVFVVPALGGRSRKVSSLAVPRHHVYSPLSWSPDGTQIAIGAGGPGIVLLTLESLTERNLTPPLSHAPSYADGDWDPAFSPDGRIVAFRRASDVFADDIYTVPAAGGEPRRITFIQGAILGLDWTADGQYLVFSSGPGWATLRLWKVPGRGGELEPLPVGGEAAITPSLSRRQGRLVYASAPVGDKDVWRVDLTRVADPGEAEAPLIASSRFDSDPAISPDGRRIAFSSARLGSDEIWVSDVDGSDATPLTSFGGPHTGTPRWSPDGREIVFDSRPEGHGDIFVVGVEGGRPRRLTREPSNDIVPSWSHDGRQVYFTSNRAGAWQIYRMPAEGGTPMPVTTQGGFAALASPDGRFVYYAKGLGQAGLWRVPVAGGEETAFLDDLEPYHWGYWAVVSDGVYYVDPKARQVLFVRFATGETSTISSLAGQPTPFGANFAISPDRRWLLYVRQKPVDGDIMLVEDFR